MGFFSKLLDEMQKPIGLKYREPEEQSAPSATAPVAEQAPYDPNQPTERQLAYAKDLGIKVPKDATKKDVSCLISRATGEDSKEAPSADFVALANGLGITFSPYIGADGLFRTIYYDSDMQTRAALYAYAIYQLENGQSFANMLNSPQLDTFRAFGEYVMQDSSLVKSLEERTSDDLLKPYRGTKIYKAAYDYLFGGSL